MNFFVAMTMLHHARIEGVWEGHGFWSVSPGEDPCPACGKEKAVGSIPRIEWFKDELDHPHVHFGSTPTPSGTMVVTSCSNCGAAGSYTVPPCPGCRWNTENLL